MRKFLVFAILCFYTFSTTLTAQSIIERATLGEANQASQEVSTEELRHVLNNGGLVFDVRPYKEYATSHIPGAVNISAKPGVEMSLYVSDVAEIDRLLEGKKNVPLVLYCNGPYCGKSKRLAQELVESGYTNVRRYQLGIPVWRALGGVTQIEPEGVEYVIPQDKTAVLIDVRSEEDFLQGSIPGANNIPLNRMSQEKNSGELRKAKNDGRLPMFDHNTRIIVFGESGADARAMAEKIALEAFHNVAFFNGTYKDFFSLQ